MNKTPATRPVEKAAFAIYNMLWRISLPVLRRNQRLAVGYANRLLKRPLKKKAHNRNQAPSAGEALQARELLKKKN